ncbi:prepilin-type N-terminal cleavage/methylation domain-containing protein [bacterium]|jgi:prepilin-type N-terminal cleavage/methylation domain-containing protein|nr:prepilin-type N-terminal cleavage/methylation domain-containing protein [bacterium]
MNKVIKQAFTLIELLVVIAIIGILSGLIVVSMSGVTQKANIAKAQVFSNSLRNTMMMNTVAEFKLDGNANDTWGAIPVGTITGATAITTDCVYGSCYSFNGTNSDNISFGDQAAFSFTNNIFTFSFWMKRASAASNIAVLGKTNGAASPFEYSIYGSGTLLSFYSWVSSGTADIYPVNTVSIDNDGWNFFVWTADGTNSYVYKNGVRGTAIAKTTNSFSDTTSPFVVGRGCNGSVCRYESGLIDEIRIYNIALPVSQIQEEYYAGLNRLLANGNISNEEYGQSIKSISLNK